MAQTDSMNVNEETTMSKMQSLDQAVNAEAICCTTIGEDDSAPDVGYYKSSGGCGSSSVDKSKAGTAPTTCGGESSEEFALSAELSTNSDASTPKLQLSGISLVQAQQQQTKKKADKVDAHERPGEEPRGQTAPTHSKIESSAPALDAEATDSSGKVRFSSEIKVIRDEDIEERRKQDAKWQRLQEKRNKKMKKQQSNGSDELKADEDVPDSDIWWSEDELEAMELNAMYMVKECRQYQEEVTIAVLLNKAYLTAGNLAKTIAEGELEDRLADVSIHAQNLEKWTAVGNSRRGLEGAVAERAIANAIQVRKDFLQLQNDLRQASTDSDTSPTNMAQHVEFLAQRCQDATRSARIMARLMGQADRDSLAKADDLCMTLPEPPGSHSGEYAHVHAHDSDSYTPHGSRRGRHMRGSIFKPIKKAVGSVFRRQSSREVNMKRIQRKLAKSQRDQQQQQQDESESQPEFRRSFLEKLDYGDQEK